MRIINVRDEATFNEAIAKAVEVLKGEGVVMHSTDTCFGLAGSVLSKKALAKVYELKQMSKDKPVSMMVESLEKALKYTNFSDIALGFVKRFWPGPVTCIVSRTKKLPTFFNKGFTNVGVRCPDHKISLAIVKAFGSPITTTSANLSGLPEVKDVEEYLEQIKKINVTPDLIIHEQDYLPSQASTIVDFSSAEAKIVREGMLLQDILAYLVKGA